MRGRFAIVVLVLVAAPFLGTLPGAAQPLPEYRPHPPISIQGDTGFLDPTNGVVGGTGMAGDPFIIENWEIDPTLYTGPFGGNPVDIRDTTLHFVFRHCRILPRPDDRGFYVQNVRNGALEDVIVVGGETALDLRTPTDFRVEDFTSTGGRKGAYIDAPTRLTISGANFSENDDAALYMSGATDTRITNLSADRSRVANAIGLNDARNVTLEGISLDYGDAETLGQDFALSLYNGRGVRISNVHIRNPPGGGLALQTLEDSTLEDISVVESRQSDDDRAVYLYEARNVSLTQSLLERNAGGGLYVQDAQGLTIEDVKFIQNRGDSPVLWVNSGDDVVMRRIEARQNGDGILAQADGASLVDSTVVDNNGTGVDLQASHGRVSRNTIERNSGGGLVVRGDFNIIENNQIVSNVAPGAQSDGLQVEGSENVIRNNTVRANGGYGITLRYGSQDNDVTGNHVSENARGQIYIESRSGENRVENNDGRVQYRRDSPGPGVFVFLIVAALALTLRARRNVHPPGPND